MAAQPPHTGEEVQMDIQEVDLHAKADSAVLLELQESRRQADELRELLEKERKRADSAQERLSLYDQNFLQLNVGAGGVRVPGMPGGIGIVPYLVTKGAIFEPHNEGDAAGEAPARPLSRNNSGSSIASLSSMLSGASGKLPVLASQRSRSSSPGFEGGRERLDTVEDDDDGGGRWYWPTSFRPTSSAMAAAELLRDFKHNPYLGSLHRSGSGPMGRRQSLPGRGGQFISAANVQDWLVSAELKITGLKSTKKSLQLQAKFMKLPHLADWLPKQNANFDSPLLSLLSNTVSPDETCLDSIIIDSIHQEEKYKQYRQWIRAGPREALYFDPTQVVAAIVTCGGLCPGLNNVIQAITKTLLASYGARKVWGIPFGYKGLLALHSDIPVPGGNIAPWAEGSTSAPAIAPQWQELNSKTVALIHKRGGTILGSSRGYPPDEHLKEIIERLKKEGVNQLYIIGGDGTHKGANAISQEAVKRKLALTVCCVPKTIDNDIAFIDKSFGFESAVGTAVGVINCALIEAQDSQEGVGIVKLMGREAGFVAMMATLASNDVNICLIPESPFDLDKLCEYIGLTLDRCGHCIIVCAEGAGLEHFQNLDLGLDESGNKRLPDVGTWLKEKIRSWWRTRGRDVQVRYIDPSYQLRSVSANPSDSVLCSDLGSTAVHGAMAGFSGFSAGRVNQRYVYIPIEEMCKSKKVKEVQILTQKALLSVDINSRVYNRMRVHTGQPELAPDEWIEAQREHTKTSASSEKGGKVKDDPAASLFEKLKC